MDQAVIFAGAILRLSCVECLELSETSLLPKHAKTLNEAMRASAIRRFYANRADFTALDAVAFLAVVGCRGLRSLEVRRSIFAGGFALDDMIRASAANGALQLHFLENRSESSLRFSDEAFLDFCFRADAAPGQHSISLELEGAGVTDLFLTKFFERLLSSDVRPSGRLVFYGAVKQRVLSAYAQYLAWDTRYRFPLAGDDNNNTFYEVVLWEPSPTMHMWFRTVRLPS